MTIDQQLHIAALTRRLSNRWFAAGDYKRGCQLANEAAALERQASGKLPPDSHPGWRRLERDLYADRYDFFNQ